MPPTDVQYATRSEVRTIVQDDRFDTPVSAVDNAFKQAQADGYLRVRGNGDNSMLERWSLWCGRHNMPIIQVWEGHDRAWIALDLVFLDRRLSTTELERLREAWMQREPRPNALFGISPLFCHFAGLDSTRASQLARDLLIIIADGSKQVAVG